MPSMLQSMGSQRVGHDWVTENNNEPSEIAIFLVCVRACVLSRDWLL